MRISLPISVVAGRTAAPGRRQVLGPAAAGAEVGSGLNAVSHGPAPSGELRPRLNAGQRHRRRQLLLKRRSAKNGLSAFSSAEGIHSTVPLWPPLLEALWRSPL